MAPGCGTVSGGTSVSQPLRSARTRPCASERKTSRASTADLPEPGPPVTMRVLLALLASEDAGWLSQSTSSARCPEKGHAVVTPDNRPGASLLLTAGREPAATR
jgi:hypothetical protein